ncbi:hypothetical protein KAH43_01615, partial [Candidatus Bipolaricaulota bacterium]|nr:hypothetical protein [Candidatus Bipolaricaulota bacterium]
RGIQRSAFRNVVLRLFLFIGYILAKVNNMRRRTFSSESRNAHVIAVLVVVLLLTGCAITPTPDVSGTWTGIVVFDQGDEFAGLSYTLTLMLVQQGSDLSGNAGFGFMFSFMVPIQDGSISGSIISVAASGVVSLFGSSETVSIELDGECSDTSMSGTGEYRVGGVLHTFTWQATQ